MKYQSNLLTSDGKDKTRSQRKTDRHLVFDFNKKVAKETRKKLKETKEAGGDS